MKEIKVKIELLDRGCINLALYPEIAQETVTNFVNLINQNYFDGVIFHRVIANFMIQTGAYYIEDNSLKKKKEVKSIKGEFKSNGFNNELKHKIGVISMARTSDKNSASSQFFICVNDCPHLDGEYAAFGKCIDQDSIDLIKQISETETCSFAQYFNDFPVEPITIKKIVLI